MDDSERLRALLQNVAERFGVQGTLRDLQALDNQTKNAIKEYLVDILVNDELYENDEPTPYGKMIDDLIGRIGVSDF